MKDVESGGEESERRGHPPQPFLPQWAGTTEVKTDKTGGTEIGTVTEADARSLKEGRQIGDAGGAV